MLRHILSTSFHTSPVKKACTSVVIYTHAPIKSFESIVLLKFNTALYEGNESAEDFYRKHISSNHLDTNYQRSIMTKLFRFATQKPISADTLYWFKMHEHELDYTTIYEGLKHALHRKDKKTAYLLLLFFPNIQIPHGSYEILLNAARELGDPDVIAHIYEKMLV